MLHWREHSLASKLQLINAEIPPNNFDFERRMLMSASSKVTIDHDEIRAWVEARGGKPSDVIGTGGKEDVGLLRIDFPGYSGEGSLEEISWDEFFEKFEEKQLAFLYQEETADGHESRFCKLINRKQEKAKAHKG
jgi:hypothetical protein